MSRIGDLWATFHAVAGRPLRRAGSWLGIVAIAMGCAMGFAVHLVNRSAIEQFERGVRELSGSADLAVEAGREGFDEELYATVARAPGVRAANPVVELQAIERSSGTALLLLGIDPLRSERFGGVLEDDAGATAQMDDEDPVWLTTTAARSMKAVPGERITLRAHGRDARFLVRGLVDAGSAAGAVAVVDIATAQWRFDLVGRLSRIDLRIDPATPLAAFIGAMRPQLPPGVLLAAPQQRIARMANLTRAYRVNLTALALVALLTGACLVLATRTLAVLRQRSGHALARVLGLSRRTLSAIVLVEGAMIGTLGGTIGIAVGTAAGTIALQRLGGGLGASTLELSATAPEFDFASMALFLLLGIVTAVLGSLIPALEAGGMQIIATLRGDDGPMSTPSRASAWVGAALLLVGIPACLLPPWSEIPVGAYLGMLLFVLGALMLLPHWIALACHLLRPSGLAPWLALELLRGSSRRAALSLAAMVTSVALVAAMAIMVGSFRHSLDAWLDDVLPADLYARASGAASGASLDKAAQARIASLPGVGTVDFVRRRSVLLDPARSPVTLIARGLDRQARARIPLVAGAREPGHEPPISAWVSEQVAEVFHIRPGATFTLPLDGRAIACRAVGVWRDYARQNGSILIDIGTYRSLTGDVTADDAAIRVAPGYPTETLVQALRTSSTAGSPDGAFEVARQGEIRTRSLEVFDRTFLVTYALEAVALAIGLLGIGASVAAQTLDRRREFGVLRHLGLTRGDIARVLRIEGGLLAALGVVAGLGLGALLARVLIDVVNPQSFHWSMDFHPDWGHMFVLALGTISAATLVAGFASRLASGGDTVAAVKEDW